MFGGENSVVLSNKQEKSPDDFFLKSIELDDFNNRAADYHA
jgi:hypothetical protein